MSGYLSNATLKEREKTFAEKLNKKDKTKIYHHGFIDVDSNVYIKCLNCGSIYSVNAQVARKKSTYIYCQSCEDIKKKENKKQKEIQKKLKLIQKDRMKKVNKLLNSVQLSLSICKHCGELFIGNTLYCSSRCRDRHSEGKHTRHRIEKAKQNGKIDYTITLDKLIKRDNNICYICNRECNLNDYTYNGNTFIAGNYYPSIDHIIPLAKGGTHEWSNVKLAHRICNTLKRDKI